jgi:very-short-patch-repair endonuclease
LDFASIEAFIAIEVDGGQHSESLKDVRRTEWLVAQGWQVIRVWNNEIIQQPETVAEMLLQRFRTALKGV